MKIKKAIIFAIIIILGIVIGIFIKNNYKNSKTGNNISNKSADEIENYILSIESYNAVIELKVKSNKNENTYKLKQQYVKDGDIYKQEIIEPEQIAGVQFIYNGNTLKVENTKLNLNKIYENYQYIENSELSLKSFIDDYSNNENKKCYEENGKIILEVEKQKTRFNTNKKLYIDKEQGKIEKMEIKDGTQNDRIYILYNEIEINTLKKEEILAFSIEQIKNNI